MQSWSHTAGVVLKTEARKKNGQGRIAIIAGSRSDIKIVEQTSQTLSLLGIDHEVKFISAHRSPEQLRKFILASKVDLFIGIAGLSAQLPGFIASITSRPVIGVPVSVKLGGLDALLAIVQMPSRVPVACVGIDNGKNAAILAGEILALKYPPLLNKVKNIRK